MVGGLPGNMKIIAFIPVRGGSKSIPLKNIKLFCGEPLINWSIKALLGFKKLSRIYIATDSDEIADVAKGFNNDGIEIFHRSKETAQDNSSTESVLLEFIENNNIPDKTIIVLVQVTCPLTQTSDFENAYKLFTNGKYDSLLTVARIKRFLWKENGVPINYDYRNRPRRQDFNGVLMENGAFYMNTVKNIKKYSNRLSGKIATYEMPDYTAVDIDEPEDWNVAENLMQKHILIKQSINHKKIKIFLTDVDGVLTDAGMYYSENGDELKKFNTKDGKGIELLRNAGIKTGIITSENTKIVENRANKLRIDYLYQGVTNKVKIAQEICTRENIGLNQVAYIGDDLNDLELLNSVGLSACPNNAVDQVKQIKGIRILNRIGGDGAVREFVDFVLNIDKAE